MLLERLSAGASSGLVSNTADHARKIAALYRVPPPGPGHAVIGLSLPPGITRRGRCAAYPDSEAMIELLFVGRDEHRKGFDALLAAHGLLARAAADGRLPPYALTIVGVAEDALAGLSPEARARTRCFHRVEEPVLHELFERAHAVVAPSRYESFGLVYQEAMMFGRPIVACEEDPSARLFVGETGAGLLAERCDGDALAAALARVIGDPALRSSLRAASRVAAGAFTRETLARETLAAYRAAMGSNGRSSASSSFGRPAPADIAS